MKSVFISFNQALREVIVTYFDSAKIKGFTFFEEVQGRGSFNGEAHFGSHAWPTLNSAIIAIVEDDKVAPLLKQLKEIDQDNELLGLRAFVWNIEASME